MPPELANTAANSPSEGLGATMIAAGLAAMLIGAAGWGRRRSD